MKIKEKGKVSGGVAALNLVAGKVYKSPGAVYVMACDEDYVIVLENGSLLSLDAYDENDMFVEVEAILEILSE